MAAMIAGISTVAYLPPPRATQVVEEEGEENEEVGRKRNNNARGPKKEKKKGRKRGMLQRDSSRKLNGSARGGDFGQFLPLFLFLLPHAGGFSTAGPRERY